MWPAKGAEGAYLMREWAAQLDEEIGESKAKVVVACGGVALQRLTGFTNITKWRGSVLRETDVPLKFSVAQPFWKPVEMFDEFFEPNTFVLLNVMTFASQQIASV